MMRECTANGKAENALGGPPDSLDTSADGAEAAKLWLSTPGKEESSLNGLTPIPQGREELETVAH